MCVCVYDSKFDVAQLNSVIYKLHVLYTYIYIYICILYSYTWSSTYIKLDILFLFL